MATTISLRRKAGEVGGQAPLSTQVPEEGGARLVEGGARLAVGGAGGRDMASSDSIEAEGSEQDKQ